MNTSDILGFERDNTDKIHLFRGPLFWKAYEVSAYIVCTQIAPLKVTRKFVKVVDDFVVSVGFPISSESRYINKLKLVGENPSVKTFESLSPVSMQDFLIWKNSIPVEPEAVQANEPAQPETAGEEYALRKSIMDLNLAQMTPFEALRFLVDLKDKLTKQ